MLKSYDAWKRERETLDNYMCSITKQSKVKGKKRVFNNTDFKTYLYKEYEISFGKDGKNGKEIVYSVGIEIPIEIIKEKAEKELKLLGVKIPLKTKKTITTKTLFLEIPFRLSKIDFDEVKHSENFVKSHHQKIVINGYEDLENLSYKEKFTEEDLNNIKEIVKKLKFEIVK